MTDKPNPYKPATGTSVRHHLHRMANLHQAMWAEAVAAAEAAQTNQETNRPAPGPTTTDQGSEAPTDARARPG